MKNSNALDLSVGYDEQYEEYHNACILPALDTFWAVIMKYHMQPATEVSENMTEDLHYFYLSCQANYVAIYSEFICFRCSNNNQLVLACFPKCGVK